MCGINGIFHRNNQQVVSRSYLEMMANTLDHRGPDNRGFYANHSGLLSISFIIYIDWI